MLADITPDFSTERHSILSRCWALMWTSRRYSSITKTEPLQRFLKSWQHSARRFALCSTRNPVESSILGNLQVTTPPSLLVQGFLKALCLNLPTSSYWSIWWAEDPSTQQTKRGVDLSPRSSSTNHPTLLLSLLGSCTLKWPKWSLSFSALWRPGLFANLWYTSATFLNSNKEQRLVVVKS